MEEAQELTATNAGQPHIAVIQPVTDLEEPQEMTAAISAVVTVSIEPAEE